MCEMPVGKMWIGFGSNNYSVIREINAHTTNFAPHAVDEPHASV